MPLGSHICYHASAAAAFPALSPSIVKQALCRLVQSGVLHFLSLVLDSSLTHPNVVCIAGVQFMAAIHKSLGACEHPRPPHCADPLQCNQHGFHHHLQRHPVYGLPARGLSQPCSPTNADPPSSATAHAACSLCYTVVAVHPSPATDLLLLLDA